MRVFFIGICGTAMGNAAVLLKNMGHEVAGSDAGVYPPMSDVLSGEGIELFEGFQVDTLLAWNPDRVVVGNAVSRGNPQVEYLLETRSVSFVSLPQLIGEDLIGNRPSMVIAGTHGKTTTTSLAAYTLDQMKKDPGYLIGGVPLDLPGGNQLGNTSSPFVIEGDEYDSAFFDKRSKFIHYRPRVLVLNNLEFDHGDIFRDLEDISRSFTHLLRIVPSNGFILRNGDDPNLLALPEATWTHVLSVGTGPENDLVLQDFEEDASGSRFNLVWRGEKVKEITWQMPGLFNARNLSMAILAAALIEKNEVPQKLTADLFHSVSMVDFSKCQGVKRRQEILWERGDITMLSDFAHHPTAIGGALESLRARYPDRRLVACFEPRSNTAVTNVFQDRFAEALSLADHALIGEVHRAERIPEQERIHPAQMVDLIQSKGKKAHCFATNQELKEFLISELNHGHLANSLITFFSNGSFDGIIQQVTEKARKEING